MQHPIAPDTWEIETREAPGGILEVRDDDDRPNVMSLQRGQF